MRGRLPRNAAKPYIDLDDARFAECRVDGICGGEQLQHRADADAGILALDGATGKRSKIAAMLKVFPEADSRKPLRFDRENVASA